MWSATGGSRGAAKPGFENYMDSVEQTARLLDQLQSVDSHET